MITNPFAAKQASSGYRWVMLILCVLTPMLVITLPNLSLPPLFKTISEDLNLSLVQIGMIWGMISFAGVFFALIGGLLGDRFGTRATLFIACLLTGLFGLLRSFAVDFTTLMLTGLFFGIFQAVIPVLLFKVVREWFQAGQYGIATGMISAGFASGLMLGPLLSTSVILSVMGGWRQVLQFYAGIAIVMSLAWLVIHPPNGQAGGQPSSRKPRVPFIDSLRYVMQLRNIWALGFGGLGISACLNGFAGYLPTYLKNIGWAELDADRALAVFFVTSLTAVIPLSIMSDRLHLRRGFLIFAALVFSTGIGLLSVVEGTLILVVIALTGLVFDSLMTILNTCVLEVGELEYAGAAMGLATMIRNLGGTFSPPLGNSLTEFGLSVPFLFWGLTGLFAVAMFVFAYKPEQRSVTGG